MKKPFRIGLSLLLLVLVLGVLLRPIGKNTAPRDTKELLRELVRSHAAALEEEPLLRELREADTQAAARWEEIQNCWESSGNDMELNQNLLPDGLPEDERLCLIVLGYQLRPDGTMEEELLGRLQTALRCAEKYPHCCILCTGGGTAAQNPHATEADTMAAWLVERGIPRERIIVENQSRTTTQNAIFSHRILRQEHPEIREIALVSSDYHIPWASILFDAQFILGDDALRVVSNAVYPTNQRISDASLMRYQMNGILDILKNS